MERVEVNISDVSPPVHTAHVAALDYVHDLQRRNNDLALPTRLIHKSTMVRFRWSGSSWNMRPASLIRALACRSEVIVDAGLRCKRGSRLQTA
jgi:hypothetical protein